jgi:hypothetical protein
MGLLRGALVVTDCPILNLNHWELSVPMKEYVYVSGVSATLGYLPLIFLLEWFRHSYSFILGLFL